MIKKPVTLTQPKRKSPVTQDDPSVIPVKSEQEVPVAYCLVHYDNQWEFDDVHGHGWIPLLSRINAKPGVNGCDESGNLTPVLQWVRSKGGNVIDPNDTRLLREGEEKENALFYNYPRYFDTSTGQKWWVLPGECPTVTLSGAVLWDHNETKRVMAAFRAHLRDSGIVSPMHRLTLVEKVAQEQHRVERLAGRVGMNPHLLEQLKNNQKRLLDMETEFEKMQQSQLDTGRKMAPKKSRKTITPKKNTGEVHVG